MARAHFIFGSFVLFQAVLSGLGECSPQVIGWSRGIDPHFYINLGALVGLQDLGATPVKTKATGMQVASSHFGRLLSWVPAGSNQELACLGVSSFGFRSWAASVRSICFD